MNAACKQTGYGAWASPISAAAIVSSGIGLGDIALDGDVCYWLENRPLEAGRSVIVRHAAGASADVTPADFSVRSGVHEYGGGAFTVHRDTVYFVNLRDQAVYRQSAPAGGAAPERLSPPDGDDGRRWRHADLLIDPARGRLLCVAEIHHSPVSPSPPAGAAAGPPEPENCLVEIRFDGSRRRLTPAGDAAFDFYASPALSPDGNRLAWLCWRHPQMPWDGTELWLADLDRDGQLQRPRRVAGGPEESVFQPQWGPDGRLYFVSDRSNWWNLYRLPAATADGATAEALTPVEAEFGMPQWVFRMSTYGFDDAGNVVCAARRDGNWGLFRRTPAGALTPLTLPFTDIEGLRVHGRRAVFQGGSPILPGAVVEVDLDGEPAALDWRVLKQSSELDVDETYLSAAQPISFPNGDGGVAHAFYYPPRNPDYTAAPDDRPPLLVKSHGGPTASTSSTLNMGIQYWTSRGFAVVDVNYRGSTGYGRDYRRALYGRWGVADVDDCVAAARYLIGEDLVDGERCAIRGSSAGGYTTLAALTFRDLFKAGASYYGISDLEILARDTHKFESRYLDQLIGPYPANRSLYRQRSPIHHVDRLAVPVIFLQGLEDKVVPPNQAELMVDALRRKHVPVAYVTFAEEKHGFRQAKNIQHALEAELYFYARLFGFADEPVFAGSPPIVIENLG